MECARVLSQWLSKTREIKIKIVRVDAVLKCANVCESYLQMPKAFHYVNLIQKVDKISFKKNHGIWEQNILPILLFFGHLVGKVSY